MILIKNAFIVELDRTDDVLIENGKIKKIGSIKEEVSYDVLDATGMYMMPSFSDSHFHLRNPGHEHKQTYKEANDACLKGGYTDVIALANTNPVVDCKEVIDEINEHTSKLDLDVYQVMTVSKGLKGKEAIDFDEMLQYTKIFSEDGKNVDDEQIMEKALKKSKELGFLIMDHSEPESEMIKRNIDLVRKVGGNLHFCHTSKKASIEEIRKAKDEGIKVTVEVTPHHLFAVDMDYKVHPPIAHQEDKLALIKAIKDGYIDSIGTDHAPHTEEDKKNGSPGIINIENAYSMIRKVFYEHDIDMKTLVQLMSIWPAKLVGKEKGIKEGNVADIVLCSDEEYKLNKNDLLTRSKNTPFDGMDVKGRVALTISKGVIVYDNGQIKRKGNQ